MFLCPFVDRAYLPAKDRASYIKLLIFRTAGTYIVSSLPLSSTPKGAPMKIVYLLFVILAIPLDALASSNSENCSNGEGTVRFTIDHRGDSTITLTERTWSGQSFEKTDRAVEISDKTAKIEYLSEVLVEEISRTYLFTEIKVRKVRITNKDATPFASDIVDTTEDKLAVETQVICERKSFFWLPPPPLPQSTESTSQ
jgi:hypothetical protein